MLIAKVILANQPQAGRYKKGNNKHDITLFI